MGCHTCHQKGYLARECPTIRVAAVTVDTGPEGGGAKKEMQSAGNRLLLLGRLAGCTVWFLVDTGSGVSLLVTKIWRIQKGSWRDTEADSVPWRDKPSSV